MTGKFICLEGIDGSGKTTLAKEVAVALNASGSKTVFVDKKDLDFPLDPHVLVQMQFLRKCVWDYPAELDLDMMGDKYWINTISAWYSTLKKNRIEPLLASGYNVIVDGWVYKYLSRFSLKSDDTASNAKAIFEAVDHPDCTFLLDISPFEAARRKSSFKASESGRFDGEQGDVFAGFISYQSKVAHILNDLSSSHNWTVYAVSDKSIKECVEGIVNKLTD